jgi:formate dehydrogenase alpha subunit
MKKETVTVCPYCGAGCQMVLTAEDSHITKVMPFQDGDKYLCAKGVKVAEFVHNPNRMLKPMVRKGSNLKEVEWDEAIDVVASKFSEIKERYGAQSFGFMGSGCFTNEEIYSFQKFARAVIGTNSIDSCARICHIPSLKALMKSIGSATMSNTIDEISDTKVIFMAGYNPEACHPRLYYRKIKEAKNRGSKIIVMDPRATSAAKMADVFLQIRPGTEIPVLNAMANIIISENLINAEFIQKRVEGYDKLKSHVQKYTPEYAEKISGVPAGSIIEASRIYGGSRSAVALWGMGMTQHICGVDNVSAIINLVLLTGNVGRENMGFSPVRGQNNVQGASFIGALPDIFPGYKSVTDPIARRRFIDLWGVKTLPEEIGLTSTVFIPEVLNGKTRALYVAAENPAVSQANLNLIRRALDEVEFLVVQDIFMTETARYADVFLPGCTFAEKDGTFIRLDRAVQMLRPAIDPIGDSLPDWKIIQMVARKMGYSSLFPYENARNIWEEIREAVPDLSGITYERLDKGNGIHMPCYDEAHKGTAVRYADEFPRHGGKALFVPVDFTPPAEHADDEYPLILTTGRDAHHYNTSTITMRISHFAKLKDRQYIEINKEDALKYGISEGDDVEIKSRRGMAIAVAKITDKVMPGVAFAPFHFGDSPINFVTNNALDPVSKTPEYKVSAVRIKKADNAETAK